MGRHHLGAADTTTGSFLDTSDLDGSCWVVDSSTPHPTGVVMTRPGYYSTPSLDDMAELMDPQGNVLVEDLTIGRVGYGAVFFPGTTNVAGMNIDEIVHIRRKEVIVYPDDDKKPPLGEGLNKKAEVTLDCVWPTDKSTRTPIKSPERLKVLNYSDKIEQTTAKIGAKFIDYRPETGSWVFQVQHFSKYGLDDSDEEVEGGDLELQKKLIAGQQVKDTLLIQKLKLQAQQQLQQKEMMAEKGKQQASFTGSDIMQETCMSETGEEEEENSIGLEMMDAEELSLKRRIQEQEGMDTSLDSKYLAASMGVSARNIQGMKASFFGESLQAADSPALSKKKREPIDHADMDYSDLHSLWKKSSEKLAPSSLFGAFKHPASLSLPQSPAFSDKESYGKEGYEPVSFQKAGLFGSGLSSDVLRPTPQTFLHPPVMEHKLLPSGLKPEDVPPRILGARVKHSIVHPRDSVLYKNNSSVIDAGCVMGRSFRVGWGNAWNMVHSGFPIGQEDTPAGSPSILPTSSGRVQPQARTHSWQAVVEQLHVYDYMDQHSHDILKQSCDLLEIHLDHSRVSVEDGAPLWVPEPGVDCLHKVAQAVRRGQPHLASSPDHPVQQHMQQVVGLCESLWGNLDDAQDLDKSDAYVERQLRRQAVSQWLIDTSQHRVAAEMEEAPLISPEGCLRAVFSKLTVRDISEACMLAQRGRDHRMALMMAQATTGQAFRQLLASQLEKWAELEACQFIKEQRLKIYCLLAGQLVWVTSDTEVNTCQGLDWKRALALHLWYKCQAGTSVQQALSQYQKGFQGTDHAPAYCAAPRAPYLEGVAVTQAEEQLYDTAYHLLCLYADDKYPLEGLLSPSSSTASHLDYRLSWHLLTILQSLGYQHTSPQCRDTIHVAHASQLESLGLWHWAAFVLLHIPQPQHRHKAVSELLHRHLQVGEELTDREQFLVDKLSVPLHWLHQAKAVRAGHEGNREAEARHWLLAGDYNRGHTAVIRHLAADAIINESHDYLRGFLDSMSAPQHSLSIQGWAGSGKVFLDFINIKARLEHIKQSPVCAYDLEQLEPAVTSLCTRVKSLACHTAKDRLCQAEMAKTAATMLRGFLALQGKPAVSLLTQHITDSPMPEDYKLQELQAITRARLMELV